MGEWAVSNFYPFCHENLTCYFIFKRLLQGESLRTLYSRGLLGECSECEIRMQDQFWDFLKSLASFHSFIANLKRLLVAPMSLQLRLFSIWNRCHKNSNRFAVYQAAAAAQINFGSIGLSFNLLGVQQELLTTLTSHWDVFRKREKNPATQNPSKCWREISDGSVETKKQSHSCFAFNPTSAYYFFVNTII